MQKQASRRKNWQHREHFSSCFLCCGIWCIPSCAIKQTCQGSCTASFFSITLCQCQHCTFLYGSTVASLTLLDPTHQMQVVSLLCDYLTSCIWCVGQGAQERSWYWHCSWGMCCLAGARADRSPPRRHAPLSRLCAAGFSSLMTGLLFIT